MMPTGGGQSRAQALTTLEGIIHQQKTQPMIKSLIEEARADTTLDTWQKTNLELINKQYTNATLIPNDLIQAHTKASMISQQQWRTLRPKNDWKSFLPYLTETFKLTKEIAEIRAHHWQQEPYDFLIDQYSPGFNQANIEPLFSTLEATLPDLINQITASQPDTISPKGPFNVEEQRQLNLAAMRLLQFDFNHGRLDTTYHPFCGGTPEDTRITTRYDENNFLSSLMAVCHETGHGRYEQGLPTNWRCQPVGEAFGMAVHESQSLLIEMQICRSHEFIQALLPEIRKHLGEQAALSVDNLSQLSTEVRPSLIRVDADEVTYPLHVLLRYKLEKQLMNNQIQVRDLPDAWNALMQQYLNLNTENNDQDGVMQDVHWPSGCFGYFPAYTLGRLIAAQLFVAIEKQHPDIMQGVALGKLNTLFDWLQTHIYNKAHALDIDTLLIQATGKKLSADDFIQHLHQRYLPDIM